MLEEMLRAFGSKAIKTWDMHLPECEFAINNAFNESIRNTPFFLNYGRHPRSPSTVSIPVNRTSIGTSSQDCDKYLAAFDKSRAEAQRCLRIAQERHVRYANKKRKDLNFEVGDFVLLDTKNIKLKYDGPKKLQPRFLGPFQILKTVGKVAYELRLPSTMEMHDVFHVSLLKPYKRRGEEPPGATMPDGQTEYEVESILDHDDDVDNKRFYYIKWVGYDIPTWEAEAFVQKNCKQMIAEYFQKLGKPNSWSKRWSKREHDDHVAPQEPPTADHRPAVPAVSRMSKEPSQVPISQSQDTQNLRRSARMRGKQPYAQAC